MKIEEMSKEQLIEVAKTTTDSSLLEILSHSREMLVRRSVARSKFTDKKTLERLTYDVAYNVSYMASINEKNHIKRDFFDISNPCITCTKDERTLNCTNCQAINSYYKSSDTTKVS